MEKNNHHKKKRKMKAKGKKAKEMQTKAKEHGFLTKSQVPGDAVAEGNGIEEATASPCVDGAGAVLSAGPVVSKECDEAKPMEKNRPQRKIRTRKMKTKGKKTKGKKTKAKKTKGCAKKNCNDVMPTLRPRDNNLGSIVDAPKRRGGVGCNLARCRRRMDCAGERGFRRQLIASSRQMLAAAHRRVPVARGLRRGGRLWTVRERQKLAAT